MRPIINSFTAVSNGQTRTSINTRIRRGLITLAAFAALSVPAFARGPIVSIDFGLPSRACASGFGICSITIDPLGSTLRGLPAEATLQGNQLTLSFHEDATERGDLLVIEEPVKLDPAAARELGASSLTIKPGAYQVDYLTNPHGTVTLPVEYSGIVITIHTGIRSRGCTGFGICSITIGRGDTPLSDARAIAMVNGNSVTLEMLSSPAERGDVLVIDEDIVLDKETSMALGSHSVTISRGSYPVDYSSNPHGTVQLAMSRIGITINIEVGRRSRNCRGFGICSITVNTDFTDRTATAVGRMNGNQLHLDFTTQPQDQEKTLVIDEPITLDEQTAQALGTQALMILPGAYPVDYSQNPNGSVVLATRSIGITIDVKVGRQSRDCRGFGICSIIISTERSTGTTQAIGSIEHGTLNLMFTSDLPEQGDVMMIDEDIVLDSATSRALGSRGVVVKKGAYQVQRDSRGVQHVQLGVQQNAIGITIYIGRASSNCRGFGICRIVFDRNLAMETVRAIATAKDGGIQMEWLDKAPEQGSVLMIDDAITLDPAIAAALGLENVEIAPGPYAMDYENNADGTVQLSVRTTGTSSVDAGSAASSMSRALVHPNPTSGATTIQFPVHHSGPVTVLLSNAAGQQVATLADGIRMEPGTRSISFNASSLPDGIYLYSVRSAGTVESGTVIVTR